VVEPLSHTHEPFPLLITSERSESYLRVAYTSSTIGGVVVVVVVVVVVAGADRISVATSDFAATQRNKMDVGIARAVKVIFIGADIGLGGVARHSEMAFSADIGLGGVVVAAVAALTAVAAVGWWWWW
jgi:hypothetical protein